MVNLFFELIFGRSKTGPQTDVAFVLTCCGFLTQTCANLWGSVGIMGNTLNLYQCRVGLLNPIYFIVPNLIIYISTWTQISILLYICCGSSKNGNLNLYDLCTLSQPDLETVEKLWKTVVYFLQIFVFKKKSNPVEYQISVHQLNMIAIIQIQIFHAILPGTGSACIL